MKTTHQPKNKHQTLHTKQAEHAGGRSRQSNSFSSQSDQANIVLIYS